MPTLRTKQRFAGRFWDPSEMLDVMSLYYGMRNKSYPRSWFHRTLISIYRDQFQETRFARRGYGFDWRGGIKSDLLEYTSEGKLPMVALKAASEYIRRAEIDAWIAKQTLK